MNEELSSQFPSPPEVRPMPASRSKVWQSISFLLIIGGAALIGWGGWLMAQQYIEASKPPPARILEVSLDDLTPTATPSSTLKKATPTQPINVNAVVARVESVPLPTAIATALPTETAVIIPPSEEPTQTAIEPTAPSPPQTVETAPEADEAVLSLADNPLPVVEEQTAPPAIDAQPDARTVPAGTVLSRIVAESIGLDAAITDVGWQTIMHNGSPINVWTVADYAAGWHNNSTLPGQGGNVVLSGHHNIKGEVFRYIVDLQPGDVVTVYDVNQTPHKYIVEDKFIVKDKDEPDAVRRENAKWIGPFNEERLTLVTCWPYTNNTHRIIVIGKPAAE